jgi:hypothetical protein
LTFAGGGKMIDVILLHLVIMAKGTFVLTVNFFLNNSYPDDAKKFQSDIDGFISSYVGLEWFSCNSGFFTNNFLAKDGYVSQTTITLMREVNFPDRGIDRQSFDRDLKNYVNKLCKKLGAITEPQFFVQIMKH